MGGRPRILSPWVLRLHSVPCQVSPLWFLTSCVVLSSMHRLPSLFCTDDQTWSPKAQPFTLFYPFFFFLILFLQIVQFFLCASHRQHFQTFRCPSACFWLRYYSKSQENLSMDIDIRGTVAKGFLPGSSLSHFTLQGGTVLSLLFFI